MLGDDEQAVSTIRFTRNPAQSVFAHVLAKRAYRLDPNDALTPLPEQPALVMSLVPYEDGSIQYEPDCFMPGSDGTDVVVQGTAYPSSGPCRQFEASVSVARASDTMDVIEANARRVLVLGDRRFFVDRMGGIVFSEPDEISSMPLTYSRAYGGHDVHADRTHPDETTLLLAEADETPSKESFQHTYPRNRHGRGYLIHGGAEAIAEASLPNIELATDRLTPDRLVLGNEESWPRAPIPVGFDFLGQENFPRCAFLGHCPEHSVLPTEIPEVADGYLPQSLTKGSFFAKIGNGHSLRFFRGASPWLQHAEFVGNEVIHICNMHPERARIQVPMPSEVPHMVLELFEKPRQVLAPKLRRVVVQPDQNRMIVVWVGTIAIDRMPTPSYVKKARHAVKWTPA